MAIKREKNSYINAAGASHIGQVRQANQDNYASRAGVHVLADGMGGHQGGEVASLEATSTILESGKISSIAEMVKSVSKANQAIIKRAKKDETLSGMGTTVCVLTEILGSDGEIKIGIANVGDSRVYRLGNSELTQVTLDHSLVADLVRAGELTQEEASRHPQRNILTRALGIEQDLVIDTWELPLVTSDRYLLCSDGLFNEIDDEKIAEILMADEELEKIAENLVINALEAGGNDNITALVVAVVEETEFENENWVLSIPEAELDLSLTKKHTGPAGSVLLLNCRTIHSSEPNNSNQSRPMLLSVYSSADSIPYTHNPIPSPYAGTIVQGKSATWASHDPRPCQLPPDWSTGYVGPWVHQDKERQ